MSLLSTFGVTREETKLSNGVRLVLFRKSNAPISLDANFFAGSRFDPEGKMGLAHFAEHMLVSGTKTYPTRALLAEFIANMGAYKNAHTSLDIMGIDMAFADKEDLYPFVELLAECIEEPLLDEITIEKERGAIQSELTMRKANPSRMLGEIARSLIYQDTDVGHSILGTTQSIDSITKNDILDYCKKYLNSNNLAVTVCGDLSLEELVKPFEKYLKTMNTGSYPKVPEDLLESRLKHTAFENFKGENVNLSLEFRTVSDSNADSVPLLVLGSILGGGSSARMMKKLRYELGLVYSASAGGDSTHDRGTLGFDAAFSKDNFDKVTEAICDEIKDVKSSGIVDIELQTVKNKIIKSRKRVMQTSSSWVNAHSDYYILHPDSTRTLEDDLNEINAVTTADLQRVAQKYLTKDNWYLSATGNVNEGDLDKIELDI